MVDFIGMTEHSIENQHHGAAGQDTGPAKLRRNLTRRATNRKLLSSQPQCSSEAFRIALGLTITAE